MPSIRAAVEYLQAMKDAGKLEPMESLTSVHADRFPSPPSYPNEPNPRLRTPMPASAVLQPDTVRQFFNSSVPQTRLLPTTPSLNMGIGAAIESGISSASTVTPVIPVIPVPPTTGQFYEVNLDGNFRQITSINGVPV